MRFRLTTVLLLMLAACVALGWWVDAHRREKPLYIHLYVSHLLEQESVEKYVASIQIAADRPSSFHTATHGIQMSGQLTSSSGGAYHLKLDVTHEPTAFGIEELIYLGQPCFTGGITGGPMTQHKVIVTDQPHPDAIFSEAEKFEMRISATAG